MAASDQAARPTRLRRRDVTVQHRSHHCDDLAFRSLGVPTAPLSHAWVDAVRLLGHEQNWRPWESEPVFARGRFTSPTKRQFLAAVQLGDVLIRRDRPLTSIDELGACTDATKGPGMRLARAALARLRPRTDSLMESWLRLVVWDAGFPEPRVNHEIRFASGRRYLDLSWPESKIALEYHGRQHFEDADQAYQDFGRRAWLHDMGWTLVEAVHADLLDPSALLGRLGALRW
jgi:very-short-patch-repair endonuclease